MAKRRRSKKSVRRRRRRGGAARFIKSTTVRVVRKGRSMARKSRRRRRGGGGGSLSRRGGFINKEMLFAVGGAAASGLVAPMLARLIPSSFTKTPTGAVASSALVGIAGYFLLSKVNKPAALGFAAGVIGPALYAMFSKKKAGVAGYGEPDGVDYIPTVAGYLGDGDEDLMGYLGDGDEDLQGLGEYDAYAIEA